MIHVKQNLRPLIMAVMAFALVVACGSTPEGRANKAAGKQTSPAAGKVVKKIHTGKAYTLTLRNKGSKDRTIYVHESAWIKCQIDDQYSHETCD